VKPNSAFIPPSSRHWDLCDPQGLRGIRYVAVIDWVEFVLTLSKPSQWMHLQRRARHVWGKVYVEPVGRVASCRSFRIRVNDPAGPDVFMSQVRQLARQGESISERDVKITGVEIAIDGRHPNNSPQHLAEAVVELMRHQANLAAGVTRFAVPPYFDSPLLAERYAAEKEAHAEATENALRLKQTPPEPFKKQRGEARTILSADQALAGILEGLSANQGLQPGNNGNDRGDPFRLRWYLKTRDTVGGIAYADLDQRNFSARMEATLLDECAPFSTIEEWRNFKFQSLSRIFELIAPGAPKTEPHGLMQARVFQFGLPRVRLPAQPRSVGAIAVSLEPGYRKSKRPGFHAMTDSNKAIQSALRCLTLRSSVKIRKVWGPTCVSLPGGDHADAHESPEYSNTNTQHVQHAQSTTDQSALTAQTKQVHQESLSKSSMHSQAGVGPHKGEHPEWLTKLACALYPVSVNSNPPGRCLTCWRHLCVPRRRSGTKQSKPSWPRSNTP